MKRTLNYLLVLVLIFSLSACGGSKSKSEDKTDSNNQASSAGAGGNTEKQSSNDAKKAKTFPLTIENYGREVRYEKAPSKAMSLDLSNTEIILSLGAEDKLGYIRLGHFTIDDLLPENQEKAKKIAFPEEISKGVPSLENIINLAPDLLLANSYYFNVPDFGKYEDYNNNNIDIFITESTFAPTINVETVYTDIENLAKVFDVRENGEALISSLRSRVANVVEKVKSKEKVRVMAFDSVQDQIGIGAGTSLEHDLIELAGGTNIFGDIEKQYAKVGLEDVIDRDPEVIIIHAYGDDNNGQDKVDYLKSKPELAGVSAIKNNRLLVFDLIAIFPGIQCFNTLETMADEFHK